jgi:hypothetical protein
MKTYDTVTAPEFGRIIPGETVKYAYEKGVIKTIGPAECGGKNYDAKEFIAYISDDSLWIVTRNGAGYASYILYMEGDSIATQRVIISVYTDDDGEDDDYPF